MPALGRMPIERVIWYLPAFWAGVLFNDVTAGIPVDRLLTSDIAKRPGALTAVIAISLVVFAVVLVQVNSVRKTGWLLTYLGWYGLVGIILLILAMIPSLQFRFHHYFAGLFIMPAVGFANRPSAVYQAFLLGMFLNGAGKWGFASILQTADEVRRDLRMYSYDTDANLVASERRCSWVVPAYFLH
jgi:amino acid transporter